MLPCMIVTCLRVLLDNSKAKCTYSQCTCTVLKYFSIVLVLYLSTLLISPWVLVLVLNKFQSTCTLLKYFQKYLAPSLAVNVLESVM